VKLYNPWIKDLKAATIAIKKNRHFIIEILGGGDIYLLEGSDNRILRLLDEVSGIDMIWRKDDQIKGIASRVQWGIPYNSFTIRR